MQMTLTRGKLGPGSTDLEEFEGLVPNFASLAVAGFDVVVDVEGDHQRKD